MRDAINRVSTFTSTNFKHDKILARGGAEYAEKTDIVTTNDIYFIDNFSPSATPRLRVKKNCFLKVARLRA